MNRSNRLLLLLLAGLGCTQAAAIRAQEAAEGDEEKRVQYQLVLPDEKTPENVKPEEHNPFESESEAQDRMSPGDTEENRVRDLLLRLKVTGTVRMADGRMKVQLGNIILETGKKVPSVLPDQQVELKVKNITNSGIELAWQEKRATGLPPKLMIIPINTAPRVRYQMLGQTDEEGKETKGGVNATMDMPLRSLMARENEPPGTAPVASAPPAPSQEPRPLPAELVLDEPPTPPKTAAAEKAADLVAAPAAPAAAPAETTLTPTPAPAPAPSRAVVTTPPASSVAPMPAAAAAPASTPAPPSAEETKEQEPADPPVPVAPVPAPLEPPPPQPQEPAAPASPAVESLVRLLFGNPTPTSPPK